VIKKKIFLVSILLLTLFLSKVLASITISMKINDIIITNQDIKNEASYLKALNKELEKLDNKSILIIAKESIAREVIKKIELDKYYMLDQKNPLLDKVIKNFYLKLDMQNISEFENHLKKYNLTIFEIKKKIEIETTWNALIEKNYSNQLKINEKVLKEKIEKLNNNEKKKYYLLSEIIFEKKLNESIDSINLKIKESIQEIGFENTANIYSISDTSKFGGKIGWVDEANLSRAIKLEISKLNIGNYTNPIVINNNFLILKLQDIKNEAVELDKSLLLKDMINFEFNRQLNNYSKIHYNKVKINTKIHEF
jgi:peptidyl-prolyl cis-trans isomerase SurA